MFLEHLRNWKPLLTPTLNEDYYFMKRYDLVFSIPVHEQINVVVDQLINFSHFNNGCAIVLHLNPSFVLSNDDFALLKKVSDYLGNVFINPKRLKAGLNNIIQTHLSNYEFIRNLDFEYFVMSSSNELFVKKGAYDYIMQFDCVEYGQKTSIKTNPEEINWKQMKHAIKDESLINATSPILDGFLYGGQIEGSYYKKELFEKMWMRINSFFDYEHLSNLYAKEEVYFHTLCAYFDDGSFRKSENVTFADWDNGLKVYKRTVRAIQKKDVNYFSVKRVTRELNNYIRIYVRNRSKYYFIEKKIIGNDVKRVEGFKSFFKRTKQSLCHIFQK